MHSFKQLEGKYTEWPNPQKAENHACDRQSGLSDSARETTSWLYEAKWPNQQSSSFLHEKHLDVRIIIMMKFDVYVYCTLLWLPENLKRKIN